MVDKKEDVKRHVVMDIDSGAVYGLALKEDGTVFGMQKFDRDLPTIFGLPPKQKGPGMPPGMPGAPDEDELPYGKTVYAVDLAGSEDRNLYTIVFPDKEEVEAGQLPHVGVKSLPANLVKAGLAAWPDSLKSAVEKDHENEEALNAAMKNILELVGLDNVKKDLKQNIAMARFIRAKSEVLEAKGSENTGPSLHLVFTGNPGTGKTTVAREYAKVLHALGFIKKPKVHEVTRRDLVAGYVGQTALKTREQIDKAKGGILFVDEAYALTISNAGNDFGKEAIAELVAAMENMRDDLVVIVAGYPEPMKKFIDANEGLKSRFQTYLTFDDYNIDELSQIMDFMLETRGYTMEDDAKKHAVSIIKSEMGNAKEHFGNGREVRNLVDKAEKHMAFRLDQTGMLKKGALPEDELKKALTTITLEDVKSIKLSGVDSKISKGVIGFMEEDDKEKAKKANDNKSTPPAPIVPEGDTLKTGGFQPRSHKGFGR
ncbi:MAG: AAA family ATPase [Pseudomonadota bacterium]|nr:AAA family ATPase [Pseudomonadota bacterium]QKK05895.1 MAG: AAA family ATPase [Pseudomonadota bacterium]